MKRSTALSLLMLVAFISCNAPSNRNQSKEPAVVKTDSIAEQKDATNMESNSLIDFNNPPWETGCDSLTTQLEMNMCSIKKYGIADSILNSLYDKLETYMDSQYKLELGQLKPSSEDFEREFVEDLKAQREAVTKSREDFNRHLESTTRIIHYEYKGGSMRPMAEGIYALKLTINQIKILVNLIEEIIPK